MPLRTRFHTLLRSLERLTKTDLVYLASAGWWANLGTIVISVCSLGLYIVFANVLPKEVYGMYQYLLSLAAIVTAFTLTGMSASVARSVARGYEGALRESIRVQLRWGLLPGAIALVMAGYYAVHGNSLLAGGLLLIGLMAPVNAALNTYAAFLQGKRDFRHTFLYGMGWNLPYYGALTIAALVTPSALVLLAANLLSQGIALLVVYRKTLSAFRPNQATEPDTIPYGKHLSVMNFLSAVATQIDALLAFQFLGPVGLATYSFATAIPERLSSFFKFVQTSAFPKFAGKTHTEIRAAFGKRIWIAILASLAVAGAYAVGAPYVYALLFPAYLDAVPYSQLYGLFIVASLSGLFTTALTAQKSVRRLYVFSTITPIAQIVLQLAGILWYGLWGLVVAKLAATFLALALAAALLLFRRS